VEVDKKEFAHTCTYHILVCFSQNGHILIFTFVPCVSALVGE